MGTVDWAGMLGYWSQGPGPLYKLLAAALQQAILDGTLAAGTRLPAERELAQLLAVSRTTAAGAYSVLRQDGWVESRTGSGTWVRPVQGARSWQRRDTLTATLKRNPLYESLLGPAHPLIDLSKAGATDPLGLPVGAYALPDAALAQLLAEPGYAPLGLPALRQAIAGRYAARGLPTTADQILVTNGAQQAISLAAALYVQRGDRVLIENPTFVGALDAFRAVGGQLVPLPSDRSGLRVDLLAGLVAANAPQLLFVTPTCQNPTGAILGAAARAEIARVAGAEGLPVLEDDTLADLVLDGARPHLLAHYAAEAPILTVGSMSKLFWEGLRIGWVRASPAIIARLARLKLVADLGTSLIPQAIAARLLAQTDLVQARRREELRPLLRALTDLLAQHLPSWTWAVPAGGTFLWVQLPGADAREFAQVALRYGTIVIPGDTLSVAGEYAGYLRLPFALPPDLLREGVVRLAAAWAAFTRPAGAGRPAMREVGAPCGTRAPTGDLRIGAQGDTVDLDEGVAR